MRILSFLLLVSFVGAIALFVYQNDTQATLRFWDRDVEVKVAHLVGGVYLLGMFTGWSVVGLFRRSLSRVTEAPPLQTMR